MHEFIKVEVLVLGRVPRDFLEYSMTGRQRSAYSTTKGACTVGESSKHDFFCNLRHHIVPEMVRVELPKQAAMAVEVFF